MSNKFKFFIQTYGVALFMFVAAIGMGRCIAPVWHNEPEMPEHMKRRID